MTLLFIAGMMLTAVVNEFGSVAEASKLFGCGEDAVYAGVRNGTIPSVRLGRIIRIPLRLIMDGLASEVAGRAPITEGAPEIAYPTTEDGGAS